MIITTSEITVRLQDHMGSDASICRAARVSTLGADALETAEAAGLINYLLKNRHGSPFEHASMTFLVEAPIFVVREHFRHRIGHSYNETSGRYRELDGIFWMPRPNRPLVQEGKPGEYTFVAGTEDMYSNGINTMEHAYETSWDAYQRLLSLGWAREVARAVLPVGIFSPYFVTVNPRSLMAFLALRTKDPKAAFPSFPLAEIEEVARGMEKGLEELFPLTYAAFQKNGRVAP